MIPAGSRGSAGARPSRPSFGGAMSTPLPSPLSRRTLPAAWRPGCRRETWRRRQLALSNWLSAVERAYAPFGRRRPGRKQRAERGDEGERLVDHYVMLSLGNLDIGRAGRDQALKISGVLGVEELRLRAANECERRAMKSRMNRLSQACGGARRNRAMMASSEGLTLCSRVVARGGEGLRWF